jgi:PEP-CTERM motif
MRKVGLALFAVTAAVSLAAPMANAGEVLGCRIVKSMCSDQPPKGNQDNHSVPEPATLTLLGAGVAAVGAAIARRRKNNTDK